MKTKLLFMVASDPRKSGRVAEAIRIAAGVGSWGKIDVSLYLHGPAVLALSEFPDELVDEDHFTRYLPLVAGFGHPILIEKESPFLRELGEPSQPHLELSPREVQQIASRSKYLLRF